MLHEPADRPRRPLGEKVRAHAQRVAVFDFGEELAQALRGRELPDGRQ